MEVQVSFYLLKTGLQTVIKTTENDFYPLGNKTFKSSLEKRGFYIKKKNDGNYWVGFGLPFSLK
jgi:hypothetical protein